jgi:hypothetical protein
VTAVGQGVGEQSREGRARWPVRANVSGSKDAMAGRGSAPTLASTSLIAAENGDPNGAPIRGQKPSQGVTTRPKALVGPEVTKRHAQSGFSPFGGRKKWWTGGELNSRHRDFQSRARERAAGPRGATVCRRLERVRGLRWNLTLVDAKHRVVSRPRGASRTRLRGCRALIWNRCGQAFWCVSRPGSPCGRGLLGYNAQPWTRHDEGAEGGRCGSGFLPTI